MKRLKPLVMAISRRDQEWIEVIHTLNQVILRICNKEISDSEKIEEIKAIFNDFDKEVQKKISHENH